MQQLAVAVCDRDRVAIAANSKYIIQRARAWVDSMAQSFNIVGCDVMHVSREVTVITRSKVYCFVFTD